jgi:hypothetical protein
MKRKTNSTWRIVGTLGAGRCEHCGVKRDRRITYDIRRGRKQLIVGSSCLALFVKPKQQFLQDAATNIKKEIYQVLDGARTQFLINNPDITLTHAACHLWRVQKEYDWEDYRATLKLIETLRYTL